MKKNIKRILILAVVCITMAMMFSVSAFAAVDTTPTLPFFSDSPIGGAAGSVDPNITVSLNGDSSDTVRLLVLLTVLSLLPSLLIMMTSFTRIIIVFSLLRNAMGLQQTPPNQVLVGLALFLTLFIMSPVINEVNDTAYKPFSEGELTSQEFLDTAKVPLRKFMMAQTHKEDLSLFLELAKKEPPQTIDGYTMDIVIPAFITSEIKRAFTIGFLIFLPFLIIDMVVASALMSMGMMMLPPVSISLPFKLMLFILVDGWGLLIRTLVSTYNL